MRNLIFAALLLALVGFSVNAVAAPYTIKFGNDRAFLYLDGRLRVPIYVTNDTATGAIMWIISVSTSGQPLRPDSIVAAGRTTHSLQIEAFQRSATNPNPQSFDTACFLIVTGNPNNGCLRAGDGIVAYAWLTGGAIGDIIHIAALPDGDYGNCNVDSIHAVECRGAAPQKYSFLNSALVIAPVTVEFTCADFVNTMSALPLDLPVTLSGYGPPYALSVIDFTGPDGPVEFPTVIGSNPFRVDWIPPLKSAGTYHLMLWGRDGTGQGAEKMITIVVTNSTVQGDVNCDNKVDLSDLSKLIAFLTGSGPAPVCAGK